MITVVGLGYGADDLTLGGLKAIEKAETLYVRTFLTKAGKAVLKRRADAESFDALFESSSDFEELKEKISSALLEKDCVYCVDGSGSDDAIVADIAKKTQVTIINGVSAESVATSSSPTRAYSSFYATDILSSNCFYPVEGDLIVKEIDDKFLASELKLRLLDAYGDADVFFVREGVSVSGKLSDLDRQKKYGNTFTLHIPEVKLVDKERFSFSDLMKIVFILRAPDGCPWDRVQTHKSIRNCCLEEAYELVEAVDLDDLDKMTEEAGDVTLQGVFHASIAEATGEFTVTDMISGVCKKLINRHLHIFGEEKATNDKEAYAVWEKAKAAEKSQRTYTERMNQVAEPLPALMKAAKIHKIAVKGGFKSDRPSFYEDKVREELKELSEANDKSSLEEEAGDALFALCSCVVDKDVDPEIALLSAIRKFEGRFSRLESLAAARNIDLKSLSEDELIALYNEVKNG